MAENPVTSDPAQMSRARSSGPDDEISRGIAVARVVCILFMITVHVWPGVERIIPAADTPFERLFYGVVIDHLGRAAVPLLSLFSGMLFVGSFLRAESTGALLFGKVRSLILPILLWSLPFLPLFAIKAELTGLPSETPATLWHFVSRLFAIVDYPLNNPLHFLREIFVMCVYGAAVLLLRRVSATAAVVAALAIIAVEHGFQGALLLRPPIATAFFIGMALAVAGRQEWAPSWPLVLGVLALYVGLYALAGDRLVVDDETGLSVGYPTRIAMSLLVWRLCRDLARMPQAWATRGLVALEPHIFVIFCSHKLSAFMVGGVALFAGWHESDPFYILLFLSQIVLCVVVGVALSRLLAPLPIFSGGRRREGVMAGRT